VEGSHAGGGALEPLLLGHPLSKGMNMATINMQYNFFTVEFLEEGFFYCGNCDAELLR